MNIRLAADFWSREDLVNEEENNLLTRPFSEEEIKEVFSCYSDGAPGQMESLSCSIRSTGIWLKKIF